MYTDLTQRYGPNCRTSTVRRCFVPIACITLFFVLLSHSFLYYHVGDNLWYTCHGFNAELSDCIECRGTFHAILNHFYKLNIVEYKAYWLKNSLNQYLGHASRFMTKFLYFEEMCMTSQTLDKK